MATLAEMIAAENAKRASKPTGLLAGLQNAGRVIDQGLLGGRVGQIPQRAAEIKQGLLRMPADLAALGSPEMNSRVQNAIANPSDLDKEKGMQMAMDFLQTTTPVGGLLAHTVYHGSPHKFTKFDMGKIGTGEGAQAYGHGLYFAEAPAVADEYAGKLSDAFAYVGGKRIEHPSVVNALNTTQYGSKGDAVRNALDNLARFQPEEAYRIGYVDRFKTPIDIRDSGNLYKVDIPDESIPRMLDWDKPLSEQPEGVRVAVQDLGLPADATGKDAYNALANLARDGAIARGNNAATTLGGSQSAASVDLQGYGIPGIRYLDGNSRGAGGTSNFVLFDDQMPRILEVNGQPTGLLSYADEAARKARKKKQ